MSQPNGLLPIARQMHAALVVEIGHEIEIERLVGDGRYARDVLLVCEACHDPMLKRLAGEFRALVAAANSADARPLPIAVPASMLERAMAAAPDNAANGGPDSRPDSGPGTRPVAGPQSRPGNGPDMAPARPAPPAPAALQRAAAPAADAARPASWLHRLALGWRRR